MSEIKLVVCDLDGTLLNDEKMITPYTVSVMKKVRDMGIAVCLASGRDEQMMSIYDKQLLPVASLDEVSQAREVLMRSDVMDLKDLQPGLELRGTVRNVPDFGAFVDIGVHRDGLVHISQMAQRRVNHPSEVVRVGDIVTVWVLEADAKTNRISLTMRPPAKG